MSEEFQNGRAIGPTWKQVKAVRESVQHELNLGITDAQDWCARALYVSRRGWQKWETGQHKMHLANFELLNIKAETLRRKPR